MSQFDIMWAEETREKFDGVYTNKEEAVCGCGNSLYTMESVRGGGIGYRLNDARAMPSNMVNNAIYCVCPKCRQINKHRFGGLFEKR